MLTRRVKVKHSRPSRYVHPDDEMLQYLSLYYVLEIVLTIMFSLCIYHLLLIQALETDLTKLFELAQETISDTYKLVLKSPVGLLQRRRGGE